MHNSEVVTHPSLTRREIQVARYIGEGMTCQEIGAALTLKYETVRSYVNHLRDKTNLRRKSQLAVWAARERNWLDRQLARTKEVAHG